MIGSHEAFEATWKWKAAWVGAGSSSVPARTRTMPGSPALRLMIGEPHSPQNSRSLPAVLR